MDKPKTIHLRQYLGKNYKCENLQFFRTNGDV